MASVPVKKHDRSELRVRGWPGRHDWMESGNQRGKDYDYEEERAFCKLALHGNGERFSFDGVLIDILYLFAVHTLPVHSLTRLHISASDILLNIVPRTLSSRVVDEHVKAKTVIECGPIAPRPKAGSSRSDRRICLQLPAITCDSLFFDLHHRNSSPLFDRQSHSAASDFFSTYINTFIVASATAGEIAQLLRRPAAHTSACENIVHRFRRKHWFKGNVIR